MSYTFSAPLWLYPGKAAWVFLTVPIDYAADFREVASSYKKGFGSVKVRATIGSSSWETSVFPDSRSGSYFLPVKKSVRKVQAIDAGATVQVKLTILGLS